jgi:hypothetical protein
MNTRLVLSILCALVAVCYALQAFAQSAANYDLHWNVHGAGGGAMSGANGYALNGTIAQNDAGPLGASTSANGYALNGGFWWGVAIDRSDEIFKDGFE